MTINRVHGPAKGRCLAVSHAGTVYVVGYDPAAVAGIAAQTRNALEFLDQQLAKVGSGKSALLQATVYLSDMSMKAEMDAVWCDWIGPRENWPQRACVGADLGDDVTLIEIVVTAVQL